MHFHLISISSKNLNLLQYIQEKNTAKRTLTGSP